MGKPKLSYFDFNGGRGEDCRLALHVAGVEFDDDRVAGKAWRDKKPSTPFGTMPLLEINGNVISQSNTILRFIGRGHGLHPSDPWEAARHDALMDAVEDFRWRMYPTNSIEDEDAKKAKREEMAESFVAPWGRNVEALIQGDGPFLAGENISVADIKIWNLMRWIKNGGLDHVSTEIFDGNEKLTRLFDAVASHERITDWYAQREQAES
jgi:glutathione S-transferase